MAKSNPVLLGALVLGGALVGGALVVALNKEPTTTDPWALRARELRRHADRLLLSRLHTLKQHSHPLLRALAIRAAELLVGAWIVLGRSGDHAPSWLPAQLYGAYGGRGSVELAPVDELDALFCEHDRAYDLALRVEQGLVWA